MTVCNKLIPLTVFFVSLQGLVAAEPLTLEYSEAKQGGITLKQVDKETLKPFTGEYNPGVDASTLYGKVICGYQGWFRCAGDGAGMGWAHWASPDKIPGPGNIRTDLWPDTSELDDDEKYATAFKQEDGTPYYLFSSVNYKTVVRHFKWMKDAGIDGVMLYRFLSSAHDPVDYRAKNIVLHNVRAGANLYGRTYCIKYDVSSMKKGESRIILDDWANLLEKMQLDKDPSYQHHNGKMVLAVSHLGRTLPSTGGKLKTGIDIEEGIQFLKELKTNPKYGNPCIVLGTPTGWREQVKDCPPNPRFLEMVELADVVHPWIVGRFKDEKTFREFIDEFLIGDYQYTREHGKDYLPVVYPGFSRNNRMDDGLNKVPREKGDYLRMQYKEQFKLGANMIFQAIFDEVDEATAIFKISNEPPKGGAFFGYEGLPPDYYMNLVGEMTGKLRELVQDPNYSKGRID